MPVSVATFQRRSEPAPKQAVDPLDRVLQGLQIANSAFGIVSNLENIQTARQNRGLVEAKAKSESESALASKQQAEMLNKQRISEADYQKILSEQKLTPVAPPKLGQEGDPSILKRFVVSAEGERPVFLRQMKPYESEAERSAAATKLQSEQTFKKQLQEAAQKNAEKLASLKSSIEKTKEPSTGELAKVQQAEGMIITNEGLENSLERFDPTSRVYMGQMKLPLGAKSAEWQQYETSARQFIDPLARVRTGAAMPESEFASYMQQFFPMPGDSAEMVQQKAVLRQKGIDEVMSMGRRARTDVGTSVPNKPKAIPGKRKASELPAL